MLRFKIPDEANLFFVSDFHFCHHKLCMGYEDSFDVPRDYETTDDMNADIILQMNRCVTDKDVVVFLGDFCMNVPGSVIRETYFKFMDQLHFGKFIMIMGNHDHTLKKKLKDDNVNFYPYAIIEHRGRTFFVQHRDFNECPYYLEKEKANLDMEHITLVHGHTHSPVFLSDCEYGKQNNACWDASYRPVSENELVEAKEEEIAAHVIDIDIATYYNLIEEIKGVNLGKYFADQIAHTMQPEKVKEEIADGMKAAEQFKETETP